MLNEFDAAIDQVDPAPAAPRDPFDDAIDRVAQQGQTQLRQAFTSTEDTTPDRAAEARRLSLKYGEPAAVIERNFDTYQKRATGDHPFEAIQAETPHLAEWAKDPQNAAVAKDDLEKLGVLEWLVTAPQRGFARGINQVQYAQLRAQSILRELTREEQDQLQSYKFNMEARGADVETSWFKGAVVGAAEQLPNLFGAGLAGLKYGIPAAVTAGTAGFLSGPGSPLSVPTLFAGGLSAGTIVGAGQFTAQIEAGLAYDEYLAVRDEFGQPLNPTIAKAAALATGAINGGLELVGMAAIVKTIPGLNKLGSAGVKAGVKQALRSPTVRAALFDAMTSYSGALATNVAEEVAQRAVTILAGELAKATGETGQVPGQLEKGNIDLFAQPRVSNAPDEDHPQGSISTVDSVSIGVDGKEILLSQVTADGRHLASAEEAFAEYKKTGKHLGIFDSPAAATAFAEQLHADYESGKYDQASKYRSASSVGEDLINEGLGAAQSLAFLPLGGVTLQVAHDMARVSRAQHAPRFFKALGEGVSQSKTVERLPAAAQAFLERATKDGPIETIYAPLETWNTYWQSKGIDPAKMAAEVTGNVDAYEQATVHGGDLAIPTARYAVTLAATEHNGYFSNELRLGPDEMNGREVETFTREQAAAAPAADVAVESPVRAALLQKAVAAGIAPATAEKWADLYESTFSNVAEIEGVDPGALFGGYGLSITQAGGEAVPVAQATPPASPAPAQAAIPGLAEQAAAPAPEAPAAPPVAAAGPPVDESGRALGGFAGPERRSRVGAGPAGQERRVPAGASQAELNAAAKAETPTPVTRFTPAEQRAGKAAQARAALVPRISDADKAIRAAEDSRPPRVKSEGTHAAATPPTGERPGDARRQQPRADESGDDERGGDGDSARDRGLPAAVPAAYGEVFERQPADVTAARFTPEVTRELDRILQEMQEFPHVTRTWNWLEGAKTGNAAGGAADIVPGSAGAAVYDDILYFAPVNLVTSGARKGEPGREASGSRGRVITAIQAALDARDVHNNLAEGALRVAEARAAGQWKDLHKAELPPTWGVEAPVALTDALSAAIDHELSPANLLEDESAISDADLLEEGDTSFNVDEFGQSLFDDLQPVDPTTDTLVKTDTLDTGEQQPRLPGDAGAVREQDVATPAFDAPFALTSNIAKPRNGKQTELFQPAYHGSPHIFEKFSLQAIGTGEGAQSYGWGLYFASARELADRYRENLAGKTRDKQLAYRDQDGVERGVFEPGGIYQKYIAIRDYGAAIPPEASAADTTARARAGRIVQGFTELHGRAHFEQAGPAGLARIRATLVKTVENMTREHAKGHTFSGDLARDQHALDNYKAALEVIDEFGDQLAIAPPEKPGRTYTVEIPEDADLLDYDRPASAQSPHVQAALRTLGITWEAMKLPDFSHALQMFNSERLQQLGRSDIGIRESLNEGYYFVKTKNLEAWRTWFGKHQGLMRDGVTDPTGEEIYAQLQQRAHTSDRAILTQPSGRQVYENVTLQQAAERASRALNAAGVRGIKYLDGFSRRNGAGSSNYVIFDDALVQITEFNQGAAPLNDDNVAAWAEELQARVGPDLKEFHVSIDGGGDLSLDSIAIDRGAQRAGLGANVMRELTRLADLNGKRIVLTPTPRGAEWGSTSAARLTAFYQRFGFVPNAGTQRDFSIAAGMYREPTLPGMTEFNQAPAVSQRTAKAPTEAEQTAAFDAWFADSQVVEEDGTPRVVYHGSNRSFDVFEQRPAMRSDDGSPFEITPQAFFFAEDKETAETFANDRALVDERLRGKDPGTPAVRPFYLSVQRPLDFIITTAVRRQMIADGFNPSYNPNAPNPYAAQVLEDLGRRADTWPDIQAALDDPAVIEELRGQDYDGARLGEFDGGTSWAVFDPEQIKSTENVGTFDPSNANVLYQRAAPAAGRGAPQTKTPAFRDWFGKSQVVDTKGKPLRVYHGTTASFDTFDRDKGNVEGDFGAGFYFSNNPRDVAANYAGVGPDLQGKIDRRAEQLASERAQPGDDYDTENTLEAEAHAAARAEFVEHAGVTVPVYLKLENPAVLGGAGETRLEMTEPRDDDGEPTGEAATGTLIDFVNALRDEASRYDDGEVNDAIDRLLEAADYDSITVAKAIETLRADERFSYFVGDTGGLTSTEIIRAALERAGFDGVIDRTVDIKFGSQRRVGNAMTGMDNKTVHYIAFRPEQIKSAIANRGTFDASGNILHQPAAPAGRRGALRFGPDRQMNIALFERADLSTFLHESGHFFLELFGDVVDRLGDKDPATLTDRQKQALDDYGALLQLFGVESRADITVEHHERFARTFEAYLREGKAPSLALQRTFASFRAWLLKIYRDLKSLNVTLTPDVTAILDRLVASDRAIAEAEAQRGAPALFATAAAAGMTDAQFGLYRSTMEDAHRTAVERLDAKLVGEVYREQTRVWKADKEAIAAVVRAEVYERPVYRALAAIQRGTFPNGDPLVEGLDTPPLTLSRDIILQRYGKDRLKRLPRVHTATGGMDPNTAATYLGYSSGDALLHALEDAPPMRAVIEQETRRRMIETHGSLVLDGSLADAAKAAAVNEDRDLVLRAELRALAQLRRTVAPFVQQEKAAGQDALARERAERAYERRWFDAEAKLKLALQKGEDQATIDALTGEVQNLRQKARGGAATIRAALPPAGVLRETARARIAATAIRSLRPAEFWSAGRRAAAQAIDKAARQDFDGAIVAKQQELINVHLFREAERVLEDVAARTRFAQDLGRPASRARLGLADTNLRDQVDAILDRYSFATVSRKVLDRLVPLRKYLEGVEASGLPNGVPEELLDDVRRMPYQELTVAAFMDVTDSLKALAHLARMKAKLLKAADQQEFGALRDAIVASIRANNKVHGRPLEFTKAGEKWRDAGNWYASSMKLAELTFELDGAVDGGLMWEHITRPVNAAGDAQETRFGAAGVAYHAILERFYPGRELLALTDQTFIPAINGSLSKEARLALAMNWGNQTSRDRVLADPIKQWTRAQVDAVLDTLDERDWAFIQAHWDYLNTFWEEIAAKTERLTGLRPEKVEALPVSTKFGTFAGGYHPLAYDHRLAARAGQHQAATEAKLAAAGAYIRSTTRRGHTLARVQNVHLPIRYDFSVTTRHLEQVIHDLTHHEMLIDTTRLLRDSQVAKAIYDTAGDQVYDKIGRLLQDIATGDAAPGGRRSIIDNGADFLRTRTQVAGLALNLWTALQQPLGLFNGMDRVGVRWVAKGMTRWLRDAVSMESTVQWITNVSPMMATRANTATAELRDVRRMLSAPGGWFDTLVRTVSGDAVTQQTILDSYMWHIGIAQRIADVPTWLGQYEKSRAAGEAEDRAIALADQAVLDSQGGGQLKDLAEVQRGGPVARLFMTFASYGVTVLNATARNVAVLSHDRTPAGALRFLGHMGLLHAAPALLTEMLRCGVGRSNCDDALTFYGKVGGQMITGALNGILLVREVAGAVNIALGLDSGARGYEGPASARPFQVVYNLAQQIRQGDLDEGLSKAAFAASGILFNYPAAQVQRSIDGWLALQDGTTTNPAALLFGPPPKRKAN